MQTNTIHWIGKELEMSFPITRMDYKCPLINYTNYDFFFFPISQVTFKFCLIPSYFLWNLGQVAKLGAVTQGWSNILLDLHTNSTILHICILTAQSFPNASYSVSVPWCNGRSFICTSKISFSSFKNNFFYHSYFTHLPWILAQGRSINTGLYDDPIYSESHR